MATVWNVHFETIKGTIAAYVLSLMCFISPDSTPLELYEIEDDETEQTPLQRFDEAEYVRHLKSTVIID